MYLKKEEFNAIETALRLIDWSTLTDDERNKVLNADYAMMKTLKRHYESNKKTAKYIAEKRKNNRNYAR